MESRIAPDEARIQKIEFRAMGSHMLAAVESGDPSVANLLTQVPQWFAEWEQTLSRFKEDSELSKLNNADSSANPVHVSETLWPVLQEALAAANDTEGLVVPTMLNALVQAGYNATFDSIKERADGPGGANISASEVNDEWAAPGGWRDIKTFPETRSVSLPAGMRLDFGGVAKGWAADQAARRLAEYGPALVDAGGDIAVQEPPDQVIDWPVGVDAPAIPDLEVQTSEDALVDLLAIRSGGVATSGRDYRRWQQDGKWRHHIIDPRTGQPAVTDVLTATIVGPSAGMAEVAAKVVLLLGSGEGLKWLEARPHLAGLIVLDSGQVLRSERYSKYIWSNENGN